MIDIEKSIREAGLDGGRPLSLTSILYFCWFILIFFLTFQTAMLPSNLKKSWIALIFDFPFYHICGSQEQIFAYRDLTLNKVFLNNLIVISDSASSSVSEPSSKCFIKIIDNEAMNMLTFEIIDITQLNLVLK